MELAINTDALQKTPKLGVRGRCSRFGNPLGGEQSCQVEVARTGIVPEVTTLDLFYTPGACEIRCSTLEEEEFILP
jgi:hypothetical protein